MVAMEADLEGEKCHPLFLGPKRQTRMTSVVTEYALRWRLNRRSHSPRMAQDLGVAAR